MLPSDAEPDGVEDDQYGCGGLEQISRISPACSVLMIRRIDDGDVFPFSIERESASRPQSPSALGAGPKAVSTVGHQMTFCPWFSWVGKPRLMATDAGSFMRIKTYREGKNMKPLSESLMDLAARVKQFEESSAAAREKNRATLQAQREELGATLEREGDEFEKTTAELREAAQSWWSDTREAVEHQIDVMRADFEKWQADIKAQRAERTAEDGKTAEPMSKG
ncbi:hypothetical protein IU471_10025 [Nocardia elegans]|nr:hypothetical protein [Nocardia elegans]